MSDTKLQDAALTPENLQKIGGGSCTVEDAISIIKDLTDAYETLIDFTAHVIERVAGP
jgi:hypothetical protein